MSAASIWDWITCAEECGAPAILSSAISSFFAILLSTLWLSLVRLGDPSIYPDDAFDRILPEYDFVVVGAGSAGSVVAARLSEVPSWNVLLIEAGGDPPPDSDVPSLSTTLLRTEVDWQYSVERNNQSCQSFENNICYWPRGKVLGGTSTIDGLIYVRGHRCDYDRWAAAGNEGWSYPDVLPYFKKSERLSDSIVLSDPALRHYHGTRGELTVSRFPRYSPLGAAILKAGEELFYPPLKDVNAAQQIGIGVAHGTHYEGTRSNAAKAFLVPAATRPNLHVLKNTLATQVQIDTVTKQVTGIRFLRDGEDQSLEVRVNKEVVVSAGAVNSPQLLMLSGIGPRKHLEELGIQVVQDSPVGRNLQDHVILSGLTYSFQQRVTPNVYDNIHNYMVYRSGPLSTIDITSIITFLPVPYTPPSQCDNGISVYQKYTSNKMSTTKVEYNSKSPKYLTTTHSSTNKNYNAEQIIINDSYVQFYQYHDNYNLCNEESNRDMIFHKCHADCECNKPIDNYKNTQKVEGGKTNEEYMCSIADQCPDTQFLFYEMPSGSQSEHDIFVATGLKQDIVQQLMALAEQRNVALLFPSLLRPWSRGSIMLRSTNPLDHPIIEANYFSDPRDTTTFIGAIKEALKFNTTKAFRALDGRLEPIIPSTCIHYEYASEEFWRCAIPQLSTTAMQPVGTCKMGPVSDPEAVVDHRLRVRGVRGLRVADASIMPDIVTSHNNAPSIMIGERAGDFIKEDWSRL